MSPDVPSGMILCVLSRTLLGATSENSCGNPSCIAAEFFSGTPARVSWATPFEMSLEVRSESFQKVF